eukprot:TRINITY_DN67124_c6_g2_i1.p1 TRINITY_DN67124_c6_g2~~TRINITY_DN67124_c6_g2_i1.p1  ORF type:complete len:279 (+),score=154.45 TRINITY_DN67124_c6_g2_i1:199-1035(+)
MSTEKPVQVSLEAKEDPDAEEEQEAEPMSVDQEFRYWVSVGSAEASDRIAQMLAASGARPNVDSLDVVDEEKQGKLANGEEKKKTAKQLSREKAEAEAAARNKVYPPITHDRPLHLVADAGHAHLVKQLFGANAAINARNRLGSTPLHRAISKSKLWVAVELLNYGADISLVNNMGNTCMHIAVIAENKEMVQFLLDPLGYVNAIPEKERKFQMRRQDQPSAVDQLHIKNKIGMTPIEYTTRNPELQKLLLAQDASLSKYLDNGDGDAGGDDERKDDK